MNPQDLEPQAGEIILLRGPNGSGKTSFLRALAGLDNPLYDPCDERGPRALSPQDARDALVGLTIAGEFRLRRRAVPPSLAALASRPSAEVSSGEARRVALATCEGVPLALLDEPSEGLDPEGRAALRGLIVAARRDAHGAVVLADHSGGLDDLATRAIDLAPSPRMPLPPMPRGGGGTVLVAGATSLRGRALPALSLGPGFHALRGPNGAGKSTLLQRLAGLLDPTGVRILDAPPRTGENVRLLLPHARDCLTRERVADECPPDPLVPEALRDRHPLALSGGEAQRVALAKTLRADASVYLLDEPEAHLDGEGRLLLAEAIAQRVKRGACVLAATHDEGLLQLAQTIIEVDA